MIFGNVSCDPSHRTAWGTIVVGEEAGATGRLYEILDPLNVNDVTIDRATGATSDPGHVVARTALGQLSYEGVVVLDDGTVYYSDELRPSGGKPAGGIYKFTPTTPRTTSGPIASLAESPLATGSVAVLRLASPGRNFGDYGQGTNTGTGTWVPLTTPANPVVFNLAATALAAGGYTGYYRPEDMDLDPVAAADGVRRMCWNDTGNDQAQQWGETLCLTDTATADTAFPGGYQPVVEPFVIGNSQLRMPDNLDFQPGTGILYILMDATTSAENVSSTNDQVWACLRDGKDPDTLSDGCVRVMNLRDGAAEFTGIQFLGDGTSFLIHLQHRTQDGRAVPATTDEILVTGLKVK
jgi:secreted PhoX family phosphatase